MRPTWVIARGELSLIFRSRLAIFGLFSLITLSAIASLTTWAHMHSEQTIRDMGQHAADHAFDSQPARHPHRMVHYGTYAFRPMSPLAAFDPGVDPFTGTTVFLEGHRQNNTTFGTARESSELIRFGLLTPAFVLQTLVPLVLIFLGFASVSREQASQSLLLLRAHGASCVQVVVGKFLALTILVVIALVPAILGLGYAVQLAPAAGSIVWVIAAAYTVYLLTWSGFIVGASAYFRQGRTAVMVLVSLWAFTSILLPRVAAEWAGWRVQLPSRTETDLKVQAELRAIGDSHNPDDPYFKDFRDKMLRQYNVDKVEDLPFNYRGALAIEGEALTSQLFDNYAKKNAEIQQKQLDVLQAFAFASPAIAVRRVSMAGAATDLSNHLQFLKQSEEYRFSMIQQLNQMHANKLRFADDSARSTSTTAAQRTRISPDNWHTIPDFRFKPASLQARYKRASPSLAWLGFWLLVSMIWLRVSAQKLEKTTS